MKNLFEVNIYLRIVSPSEKDPGKFLILLDSNGEIPKLSVCSKIPINQQIRDLLSNYFHSPSQMDMVYQTKNLSDIQVNDNCFDLMFNFISPYTNTKSGTFVNFNKNSIELYRLALSYQS
jgi:hypothetical protein